MANEIDLCKDAQQIIRIPKPNYIKKISTDKNFNLKLKAIEHIWYEFFMFRFAFQKKLKITDEINTKFINAKDDNDMMLLNNLTFECDSYLENFLLHYRNILEFTGYYGQGTKRSQKTRKQNKFEKEMFTIRDYDFSYNLKVDPDKYKKICSHISHLKSLKRIQEHCTWDLYKEFNYIQDFIQKFLDFIIQKFSEYIDFNQLQIFRPLILFSSQLKHQNACVTKTNLNFTFTYPIIS